MTRTTLYSRFRRLFAIAATVALATIFTSAASSRVAAEEATGIRVTRTVELDVVGNAAIKLTVKAPTNIYTLLKTKTPNVAVLLRKLGNGRHWAVLENVDGRFNDMQSSIDITYTQRSVARIARGNQWSIPLESESSLELVDIHDTTALFEEVATSQLGVSHMIIRVVAPAGSTHLKNDADHKTLCYEFEPKIAASGRVDSSFSLDHKDSIMSCLAKCYSNEHFTYLWAARSRFENTGSAILTDYRVHFRIAGLSTWSPWRHTAKVYPGQTVVDPYFPVMDLDKLNVMTGSRPEMLEVEYQYRQPNGQVVTETDSRRLQVLGCNETIFSGLAYSEIINFADRHEYLPAVLASFTTPTDPVIQELAGRVCGRAQSAGAAFTNEEAFKFLRSFYEFLADNRIAYQSPPSYVDGVHFGQHIKYGRDVLRNHAGTCVDLAILWASACEAVGLKPILIVVPGHCFPVVCLPDGRLTAIEATAVGKLDFDKANELGLKELNEARPDESLRIDIMALRKSGIQSLDLPVMPHSFLADLGYRFEAARTQNVAQTQTQPVAQGNNSQTSSSVVGRWEFLGQFTNGNGEVGLALEADGRMGCVCHLRFNNGQNKELKFGGHWQVQGNELLLVEKSGTNRFKYSIQNGQLAVYFPLLNSTILFTRS